MSAAIVPIAHVGGVPFEELLSLAPAAGVLLAAFRERIHRAWG